MNYHVSCDPVVYVRYSCVSNGYDTPSWMQAKLSTEGCWPTGAHETRPPGSVPARHREIRLRPP